MKFILPKSVKVGGVVYAIIEDPYYYNREGRSGAISYWPGKITVDADTDQVATLIHETMHGCFRHITGGDDHSENLVERISEVVRMFIADNPDLIRQLADVLESHVKEGNQGRRLSKKRTTGRRKK
jgi:predicted house-cleaning noncanonical NTP pyrophosphatase (MazG superfamily)